MKTNGKAHPFFLSVFCLVLLCRILLPGFAGAEEESRFVSGAFCYALMPDGGAEILSWTGSEEHLAVPEELDGHPVRGIRTYAFSFSVVVSVSLPETVTGLEDYVFYACEALEEVSLPDSLTRMGDNPFLGCSRLTSLKFSPDHPVLEMLDGVLFAREDHRLIWYPLAFTAAEYTVPEGTLTIGRSAFAYQTSLCRVILPDSLAGMAYNPFGHCYSLGEIVVSPEHPSLYRQGEALFSREDQRLVCYPPAYFAIEYKAPEGTRIIGDSAFMGCINLSRVQLPGSVTAIADNAFSGCWRLRSVTMPDGMTELGDSAFAGCAALSRADLPASLKHIGDYAFYGCGKLPDIVFPEGLESIGANAFDSCGGLMDIILPDSISFIGKEAFANCKKLNSLYGSGGTYAQRYCAENGLTYTVLEEY